MDFLEQLDIGIGNILLRLALAFVVLIIGRWLAGFSRRWLRKTMKGYDLTESIISLVGTLTYYAILILTGAVILAILGVPPNIIVGALGIFVIVLAITLQASLGNLAATVNTLLFKPYEVGDFIQTLGTMGVVQEIQLFSTVIVSPDRKTHILPNGGIQGAGVTNFSKFGTIRVDQAYRISYDSDADQAKQIVSDLLVADERVLDEPAPHVFIGRMAEDHIEIGAWPFVAIADYVAFQSDITGQVMNEFEEAGIIIPLPQREVHLVGQE